MNIGYGQNSPFPRGLQMPGQQNDNQNHNMTPEQYAQYAMAMGQGGMEGGNQFISPEMQKEFIKNLTDEQLLEMMAKSPELKAQFDKLIRENGEKMGINRTKPITSQDYVKCKNIDSLLDKEGGIVIEPDYGIVYKTKKQNGEKFFINLLMHAAIEEPEEKYLVELDNQAGVRIPMSFGAIREDSDKKGDICSVLDVIINPNVLETVKKDEALNDFLQQMLANYVEQKYKIIVEAKMVQPKMKYKGKSIEFQRIKGKRAPKIQQLSAEEAKAQEQIQQSGKQLIQEITNKEEKIIEELIPRPKWKLYVVNGKGSIDEYDGDFNRNKVKFFKYCIEMPLLMTGKYISLEINSDSFYLKVNKFYELILKFPMMTIKDKCKAYFNTKTRNLYIIAIPVKIKLSQINKKIRQQQQNIQDRNSENITGEQEQELQTSQKESIKIQQEQIKQNKQVDINLKNSLLDDLV